MTTDFQKIIDIVENIDISNYSKNRNFIDGSVTKLSPYISRGVISTAQRQVYIGRVRALAKLCADAYIDEVSSRV